jgi:hypothetical protein
MTWEILGSWGIQSGWVAIVLPFNFKSIACLARDNQPNFRQYQLLHGN